MNRQRHAARRTNGAASAHVLYVDDDPLFREAFTANLQDAGFAVTAFADGPGALEHLTDNPAFDVAIFDMRLTTSSGLELLDRVREMRLGIPVVMLTAFTSEDSEDTALALGAVDFLDKCRRPSVLINRLRLVVNGAKLATVPFAGQGGIIRRGPLVLHLGLHQALWRGCLVPLTLTEFRVVRLIALWAGRNLSYRRIYDEVHGAGFLAGSGDQGYRANVRAMIRRIRRKFRDVDPGFAVIRNQPAYGYRWGVPPDDADEAGLASAGRSAGRPASA